MGRTAKFAFVIRTDDYAGNFEREMCAHLTGHVGECEVGEEYVDEVTGKLFDSIIGNEQDDNGCYRPVALGCDIEGYTSQDVVIFLEEEPSQEHIDTITSRINDFSYGKEKVLGIDLVEFINKTKITKII